MKTLTYLSLFFIFTAAYAQSGASSHEVRVLARIKQIGNDVAISNPELPGTIKAEFLDKLARENIRDLQPEDEVLLEGEIIYESHSIEGSTTLKPVFLIKKLSPISLKRLGKVDLQEIDSVLQMKPVEIGYAPGTIPVTTEIASAITLTASVMMLKSITTPTGGGDVRDDMNMGLLFSAGVMATGLFVYEQIMGNSSRGANK